jgi:hypothetical protein
MMKVFVDTSNFLFPSSVFKLGDKIQEAFPTPKNLYSSGTTDVQRFNNSINKIKKCENKITNGFDERVLLVAEEIEKEYQAHSNPSLGYSNRYFLENMKNETCAREFESLEKTHQFVKNNLPLINEAKQLRMNNQKKYNEELEQVSQHINESTGDRFTGPQITGVIDALIKLDLETVEEKKLNADYYAAAQKFDVDDIINEFEVVEIAEQKK